MEDRKVALVTGGSRGIGRAVCRKLAEEGMNIAFTCRHLGDEAEKTLSLCRSCGVEAEAYEADVCQAEACVSLVAAVAEKFGSIDVLVNNAGITRDNLIMRIKDEDYDAVMNTNAKGAFYMMREVSRKMLRQKSGHIVNISSVVGLHGNAGQVNYAASKAALVGMTKSLAKELASRKITVNAVAPGMIDTDMTKALTEDQRTAIGKQIPLGEMGSPEDVAKAVAFLAGDQSSYITGQVISVDGGMAI